MSSHDPFGYLKHNSWPKERPKVKLPIWLPTTKNRESPRFTYVHVVYHIPLESSQWWLQLCFKPYLNKRSTEEVIGLQSCWSPNFGNFGTPNLGVPGQNDIWVQAPWPGTKNTIRGKMVASKSKCSNYALTNSLFDLCKSVWIIDLLVIHLSLHLGAPTCPSIPEVLRVKKCAPTPYPFVVFTLDSHLSISKSLGVCQKPYKYRKVAKKLEFHKILKLDHTIKFLKCFQFENLNPN
jgi:hypothetical protein